MYWVSIVTEAGIFSILALGLNVVWGWGGDFDLAFYGYLALGSYMTFVLTIGKPTPPTAYIIGWHLPVPPAIVLADVAVVPSRRRSAPSPCATCETSTSP